MKKKRIVAKSRPTATNLAISVSTSSSSVNSPLASRSPPEILKASSRQVGASANQNSNPDAASSPHGWQRDVQLFISTGKPVATGYQGYPENPETPEDSKDSELESRICPHYFRISPDCVPHVEKVLSIIRKKHLWSETDRWLEGSRCEHSYMGYIYVCHSSSCSSFLGKIMRTNLRSTKNQPLKSVKQVFRTTEKLIKDQVEITGSSTIEWNQLMWRRSSLLCDRAVDVMKSKTFVFADSVLCLGGIRTAPIQAWKDQSKWNLDTLFQRFESNWRRADGTRVDNFPRMHKVGNSRRDSRDDGGIKVWTWAISRKGYLHVIAQWHYVVK